MVKWQRRLYQLAGLGLLIVLCASCKYHSTDPAFNAVKQALQDEHKDPLTRIEELEANLPKVKDKQVIPFLLDYLEKSKTQQLKYNIKPPDVHIQGHDVEIIILYLQRLCGKLSNLNHMSLGGAYYSTLADMETDIAKYHEWWNTNSDHIVWDEEQGRLVTVPP